jgi:phage shock protein E
MPHSPGFEKLVSEAKGRVKEVTPQDAHAHQEKGAVLLDVRDLEETQRGRAVGATHLSRGTLELKIEQVVPDPSTEVICYCGGGSRSALAAESLQRMGYTNVASMSGGFRGWMEAGLPTE